MSSTYGKNIRISIFGQSHSEAVGVVVDGLPSGFRPDLDELRRFMDRRAPGKNSYSTPRKEADAPEFLSGLNGGVTCGAPLVALIRSKDTRSADYSNLKDVPRPGHADFTAQLKYKGAQDVAGGGHFSGRLTAPLCVAGGICLQILKSKGIEIGAHIASIGNIRDVRFDASSVGRADFHLLRGAAFPVLDEARGAQMLTAIEQARKDGDSLGGVIECAVTGVPGGLGDPMFDGMENRIAGIVFGIPAVKGIEFGSGFGGTSLRGSDNNDSFYMDGGRVRTRTNNHGGILGGITSGMPIVFRAAVKPTPSIAKEQYSVSLSGKSNVRMTIKGRHDPCIVPRAVPVVEAAAAVAVLDALLDGNKYQ
ncbi:chorismate synthase [Sporobacter termitidis DSM 10068]|uniref:Chorismate synthase n=1 Tax=Sporobacter termitidis DSM 10068 TaxID=1123282 RepID=A0A1M5X3P7_9FIRM|nr:chorismate synthase [Sporobacter termitidis]SHH93823.1 chorismate synthase [Sporobacter termitidis DSM 10068]